MTAVEFVRAAALPQFDETNLTEEDTEMPALVFHA